MRFDGTDLLSLGKSERRALLGRKIAFIPQEPLSALNPVRTIGAQFGEHLRHIGIEKGRRRALMIERLHAGAASQCRRGAAALSA